MTLQQALGRCMPAIISGDKTKIMDAVYNVAKDYLKENGNIPYDYTGIYNRFLDMTPENRRIIAAVMDAIK
jgi:hypothetical protein